MTAIDKNLIIKDWLPRYTGMSLDQFGDYVLLTNFNHYVDLFCNKFGVSVADTSRPMWAATADNITIINFGMGSAVAATVMDLLPAASVKAALFLGKCGGLKRKTQIGDLILPIAAIRGEGTSNDYIDPMIPALPSFALQRSISSTIIRYGQDYWTGTVYTTNRRVWEHDATFRQALRSTRAMAIDMETATLFVVGFVNEIPRGALLLVSDNPMVPEGVKMSKRDKENNEKYIDNHLSIGIDSLKEIEASGDSVKHLRFEE